MNPGSGDGDAHSIAAAARRRGVAVHLLRRGEDPAALARAADADALGVAGGDGSLGPVAAVAAARGLPFVCVPSGTRNHLARDVGLDRDDSVAALDAFVDGVERLVDLAFAGDRPFLNNVSLGLYATLVRRRERHRRRRDAFARLRALGRVATHRRERFVLDGEALRAHVLLVANNAYTLEMLSLGERDRLDGGELHVYTAEGLLPSAWDERAATSCVVESRTGRVRAAVDGEPALLPTPLRFRLEPRALRILVPRGTETTEEDGVENPEPTEREHELAGTERHEQEDAMRGGSQHEELPVEEDADEEDEQ